MKRLVDYEQYRRSLNAGIAGRAMQSFYEKELFGVDTRPVRMRTERWPSRH